MKTVGLFCSGKTERFFKIICIVSILLLSSASAQWSRSFTGCQDLRESDFRIVTLVGKFPSWDPIHLHPALHEPIDFEFEMDNSGNVSLWIVERNGKVKYADGADNYQVKEVGDFSDGRLSTKQNHGLVGIVKDPDFETNGWMYFFYTNDRTDALRISRFSVDQNSKELDMGSEKTIIEVPCVNENGYFHTGGPMMFDDWGDMWIGTGDNSRNKMEEFCGTDEKLSMENRSSNTNDLRGSILRIRPIPFADNQDPEPGIGRTYTIPSGNYGEHFAGVYADSDPGWAAEFANTDLVRPEVYAKGMRNPYAMGIEPTKRWITWGDCGPDIGGETEESSLITEPAFAGWPYYAGTKSSFCNQPADAPINDNPINTGMERLPPTYPATYPYARSCAMGGPILRYDGKLNSSIQMPPHLNNVWIITDFNRNWMHGILMEPDGKTIDHDQRVFENLDIEHPLAMKQGPDGAIYVNSYGAEWYKSSEFTSINRIEYTGDCDAPDIVLPKAGCMDQGYQEFDPAANVAAMDMCINQVGVRVISNLKGVEIDNLKISITLSGAHSVDILDINGKQVGKTLRGEGVKTYTVPPMAKHGVFLIRVETPKGVLTRKLLNL